MILSAKKQFLHCLLKILSVFCHRWFSDRKVWQKPAPTVSKLLFGNPARPGVTPQKKFSYIKTEISSSSSSNFCKIRLLRTEMILIFAQQQQQLFYGPLSGTTRVRWYQKKHFA